MVERLAGRHLADNVDLPQARLREFRRAEEGVLGVVAVRGRGGLNRQRCRCEQNRHFPNFMRFLFPACGTRFVLFFLKYGISSSREGGFR